MGQQFCLTFFLFGTEQGRGQLENILFKKNKALPDKAKPDELGIEDVELYTLQHVAKQVATSSTTSTSS